MNGSTSNSADFNELKIDFSGFLRNVGQLFYIHRTTETSFKDVKQVPDFYVNAWPSIFLFIILENAVLHFQGKPTFRLNDSITSLSHGLIQQCGRLIFRGSESAAYIYVYNNWKLVELPWDSPLTWYITLLTVDFFYYWVHRASHGSVRFSFHLSVTFVTAGVKELRGSEHSSAAFFYLEIHIFWAQHQVHHSSEEYNISVGVRQSAFQGWCSFIFYLPMALFVPPAHFVTHQQFNLLYQVWIHTKTIKTLGPLELVLNTPQHHRVHHGCNIYCLDKNYGGVLIIWDRIFKTFAKEKKHEDIVYGLVHQQLSFNPLYLQIGNGQLALYSFTASGEIKNIHHIVSYVFYNLNVVKKFRAMKGFKEKLNSIIKGPSWMPGTPWTGNEKDKIDIKTREIYDVNVPFTYKLYVSIHFVVIFAAFQHLAFTYSEKNPYSALVFILYIIFSLTTMGMILENHPKAIYYEMARCFIFFLHLFYNEVRGQTFTFSALIQMMFCSSTLFWYLQYLDIPKRDKIK